MFDSTWGIRRNPRFDGLLDNIDEAGREDIFVLAPESTHVQSIITFIF